MKITCPEHRGIIYVFGNESTLKDGVVKNMVIECPVCDEEVLVNGESDPEADELPGAVRD